ncbi:MAG: DHH family phosphoesterase, partial [Planctomycetota bacterium]|jgi:phosphoesterase RecJ-like protein
MEEGRETKLSIRSAEPYDATQLAGHFGGGGHQRAAGCTIPASAADAKVQAMKVIEEIWGETLRDNYK